jgi:6-phosphogluconate dehydrogenase
MPLLLLLPQSFLIEISAIIAAKKDEEAGGFLVDKIVDKTGAKGTGALAGSVCWGLINSICYLIV